ncbi:MAG: hypothetical protein DRJ38_07635 [Thermoprotei archaeon]|nr:MAG: hypothetical protein DRJ38_07635 [Thermoprotei archaeon]
MARRNLEYIVLGGITLYVVTFLFIYNILHTAWALNPLQLITSLSFAYVQIIWLFIILNHAVTLIRLAYY